MVFPHNITEVMDLMSLARQAVVVKPDGILISILL